MNPNWFIGPKTRCAVCRSCAWDLRTAPSTAAPPTRCIYGGPFAGYVDARPEDAAGNARLYWLDENLAEHRRKE